MKACLTAFAVLMASLAFNTQLSANEIEAKYQQTCFACHGTGAAGAPKTGDKAAWEPRLALGAEALLNSVKNGKGAMPPGGICMDCSDEQYQALIDFMSK